MRKFLLVVGMLVSLGFSAFSTMAWAITLDEAKAQGLVGERVDGFLGAVVANPSADVQALITSTNDGRREVYRDLAQRNGITIEAVGIVSAEKLREKANRGEYVQSTSGQWERK